MSRSWRLIIDPAANGAWNMAVDEALLLSAIAGESLPTLRLYSWHPGCLSLGRVQSFHEVDFENTKNQRWDIVRRLSGGRAILHIDELTYSISGTIEEPLFQGDIVASYLRISKGLVRFLNKLEISPEINHQKQTNHTQTPEPICFEVPSQYEITYEGKKIIGSAQARKLNGVLQHGSIPLFGDITRITKALKYSGESLRAEAMRRMALRASTLEYILAKKISVEETILPFVHAFRDEFGITFISGELTEKEKSVAKSLVSTKYAHPDWTERS